MVYVLYLFYELTVSMKILDVFVPVLSVPFDQPVFGFVLRLVHDLGGRGFRSGGEKVFHRELAWVSTGVSVRIWALLVLTDPVTLSSPVVFDFFLVEESPFSWFS